MKHNHTDYQAGQPSVKRNRVTITGKGAKRDRDKIITALLETFPDDFPGGITH
jgi:hypothetical protein